MRPRLKKYYQIFISIYGTAMSIGPMLQVLEIVRNGTSANVSIANFLILGIGCGCWGIWGIWSSNNPLVIANVVGVLAYVVTVATILAYA